MDFAHCIVAAVSGLARLCAVLLLSAAAQIAAAQVPTLETASTSADADKTVEDPLGRTTPRDTIVAFIRAVDHDDFVAAARYLQVTEAQRPHTPELARDLKALMDRYFSQALTNVSDSPSGALDDGAAIDRERIGPLIIGDRKIDLVLVRVTDPEAGPIWLISSETLAQVPGLRSAIASSWIERLLPATLVERELFGLSLAHWIVLAASLLLPFILLMLVADVLAWLARRIVTDPARQRDLDAWYTGLRWPAVASLTFAIQLVSMPSLGFPLTFRIVYARVALLFAILAFAWLLRQLLTLGFERARSLVRGRDRKSTQSLMLLGERLLKVLVVGAAIVAILILVGVDTKTALAAFGIVGVALALGAQRTVENLLGGVFLLSDRAIAVGDLCSISDRLGWIEDITLRSVRLRTLDDSLVSVPAGVLAQAGIENFATRRKILVQSMLRLRHGTSVEQLRTILAGVRKLLDEHPWVERETSRIRLVNFAPEAIELELFAYVETPDIPEFLAIREELLLSIAAVVEAAGSGFAQPTQFIFFDDEPRTEPTARIQSARDAGTRGDARPPQPIAGAHADGQAIAAHR